MKRWRGRGKWCSTLKCHGQTRVTKSKNDLDDVVEENAEGSKKVDQRMTKLDTKAGVCGFCLSNYGVAKCCALCSVICESEIGVGEAGTRHRASRVMTLRRGTDAAQRPRTCNKDSDHMVKIKQQFSRIHQASIKLPSARWSKEYKCIIE